MRSGHASWTPPVDGAWLGLGGSGHDWSSSAAGPGGLFAVEEERLARRKYGIGVDLLAGASRRRVLADARTSPAGVSQVVACELVPRPFYFALRRKTEVIGHHLAHAWCAFGASPFSEAAVLVCDNSGGVVDGARAGRERAVETVSFFRADAGGMRLLDRVTGVHRLEVEGESDYYRPGTTSNSLGHFYRAVTLRLGFGFQAGGAYEELSEDGKTMGLAPYGDERWYSALGQLVQLCPQGRIAIDADGLRRFLDGLDLGDDFGRRAALARAAQHHLERALLHCVRHLHASTGLANLCLVGGVALNSVANGVVQRAGAFERVFVPPAPGDNGTSLGSLYYALHRHAGMALCDLPALDGAFLGPRYDAAAVDAALARAGLACVRGDLARSVARALAQGAVIGWWEGRSEFGPRALGHRSVLAAPFPGGMRDRLNALKRREWFRPYGAVVLAGRCQAFFDFDGTSPYMSFVARVRRPQAIPAVTHVDGTCRVQTLDPVSQPRLAAVLREFEAVTGLPLLVNTSFNVAGEPIVETPEDALRAGHRLGLSGLVLGERFVLRCGG